MGSVLINGYPNIFFMDAGVSKLNYEAIAGEATKLIVELFFGGIESDIAHRVAAINSWFSDGMLEVKYDIENDNLIFSKKKY